MRAFCAYFARSYSDVWEQFEKLAMRRWNRSVERVGLYEDDYMKVLYDEWMTLVLLRRPASVRAVVRAFPDAILHVIFSRGRREEGHVVAVRGGVVRDIVRWPERLLDRPIVDEVYIEVRQASDLRAMRRADHVLIEADAIPRKVGVRMRNWLRRRRERGVLALSWPFLTDEPPPFPAMRYSSQRTAPASSGPAESLPQCRFAVEGLRRGGRRC